MKKKLLIYLLAAVMMLSLTACGKSEAAKAVDEQISAIGTVSLDSEAAIAAAETALAGLSEEDSKQVEGKETLTAARAAYEQLVLESQAKDIADMIAAIGAVTLESGSAIDAAQAAFNAAPAEVQALVTNAGDLNAASQKLKELKKAEGERLLANMDKEEDKVRNLRFYYPKVYPDYIDTRCYVLPYIGQNADSTWLRLMFDYTGDDWVFFKKVLFSIDGELSTRTFTYRDIVHDNDGGVVWEYIDVEGESYIDLLWKIANSQETIVRFEGDSKIHDFTIKSSDKDAIREVLTAFEALR